MWYGTLYYLHYDKYWLKTEITWNKLPYEGEANEFRSPGSGDEPATAAAGDE